ncbi:hypothetical protein EIN_048180 [Entamoeba invadens IP1]|uniref:AAA+ ATPase domain-containing protein n=1 Tax=Entamoeba invadens IP1 TaxID=370355 RepID=A0A0A1UH31_ENTIV|nr:hypothetical protein EIN_048180 [Entamoeba invadens IP1]ELP94485.1 hypothetical protein EIN_048180 [Entamoeba invadens IP1]|eukprot:XP_004261256.1 hypothetical protein EIN_048180 [Entamoeba invadens IP1]
MNNQTPLDHALLQFDVRSPQNALVGRENEMIELESTIECFTHNNQFGLVLIHGFNGIGKTTVVRQVINSTNIRNTNKVIYINVAVQATSKMLCSALATELYGETDRQSSLKEVLTYLNDTTQMNKIIVFDEVDRLKKRSTEIYNWLKNSLFSYFKAPNCVVIGISNDTEDYARLAGELTQSPHATEFCYTRNSIEELAMVIRERASSAFDEKAILHIAKELVNREGDIRSIFSLCPTAIQLAKNEKSQTVKLIHAIKAVSICNGDNDMKEFFFSMSSYEKALCCAMFFCKKSGGVISVGELFQKFKMLCARIGLKPLPSMLKQFRESLCIFDSRGVIDDGRDSCHEDIVKITPMFDRKVLVSALEKDTKVRKALVELRKAVGVEA